MTVTPGGRVGDPSPVGKPGGRQNWVDKAGGLPTYIRMVAHALIRSGHDESRAIATAVAAMHRWCAGGGHVSAKVQAAACKAAAEFAAKAKGSRAVAASVMTDEYVIPDPEFVDSLAEEALIASIEADNGGSDMTTPLLDGVYEEVVDDAPELASALLAGAAPLHPPKTWFEDPQLPRPTPLTLTADGQLFGHVALWNVDHIGLPGQFRKPPRSKSGYAFFKTGVIETEEGDMVPVGQITYAGGHASLNATAGAAAKHYDDTATAFSDVNVGEDSHGVWVAGGARPGVSEDAIRAIRASAPSGDWRPINGQLELVAICQVNVPGFPVARAMVAGGEIMSLVAAGAAPLYALRQEEAVVASVQELEDRITRLTDQVQSRLGITVSETDDADEPDMHRTVVAAADYESISRMRGRVNELKRRNLAGRMSALREGH